MSARPTPYIALVFVLAFASTLGGCDFARARRDDAELSRPPALVDPGAPPSDVLTAFLAAVPSRDTTTAWQLLSAAEHTRYRSQERFRQLAMGALTDYVGLQATRTAGFQIRLEAAAGRWAVVAGVADRRIGHTLARRVPFAFVLTRTAASKSRDDRWRLGAGATPGIDRVDPPLGAGTIYGTANVRFAVRPKRGRRVGTVRVWLDERPLAVRVKRYRTLAVGSARIEGLRRGRHRVVVLASDDRGRANAVAWQFALPKLPNSLPSLGPGDKGQPVRELQERLAVLGFDVVPDAYYNEDTEHAVTAFAKLNGLSTDGIAGSTIRRALAKPRPVRPRTRHSGRWVEIDVTRQVLILFDNGKVVRIIDISSGSAGRRTSKGSFAFYRRVEGWRQSALGFLWNPYYFHGGMAVHGAFYVPPYPASHGCVRVTLSSMERLRQLLELGMPCEVYGEETS